VVGDKEHQTVEGRRIGIDVEAVVTAHEVNSSEAERERGCGENIGDLGVGCSRGGVFFDCVQQGVG
jgi:hypothetical protein